MYRIQAFNYVKRFFNVTTCNTIEEREAYIRHLIGSNEYTHAGISWEWLARS